MRAVRVALVVPMMVVAPALTACGPSDASDSACFDTVHPTAPSLDTWREAMTGAAMPEWREGDPLTLDLEACDHAYRFTWLPLGSAWVLVRPDGAGACDVWLGGETESPMYGGGPTQYCRFNRSACEASIELGYEDQGGPAHIDSPGCTP